MTADLSEFKALSNAQGRCSIGRILDDLKPADKTDLLAALAASKTEVSHQGISAWLAKRDIQISAGPVSRHRRGMCQCDG